ncbi:hypothetical protein E4U17_006977 [Claviceps sp. LM77 group G4]|nr:hypothetical protein E4U17_006977 [Claviceps sp. LM77 group G4]KAG6059911.1 hypothetical protein E4U33_007037 [Claviceps sp. LM78 group G4]KAG6070386.1 hypothetical protein E4U16_006960 [Claviceps sp. LM84 group G4]
MPTAVRFALEKVSVTGVLWGVSQGLYSNSMIRILTSGLLAAQNTYLDVFRLSRVLASSASVHWASSNFLLVSWSYGYGYGYGYGD